MKEFPYKTSFAVQIKPVVSEEKDKYLALASLKELEPFIPKIDSKSNADLLPIAFNGAVAGRVNRNDDVITKETALAIYKSFLWKQINLEHKRSNVVGVILTAGFSEFGTDKPLTEEEVKASNNPFNITLGGVLWRVVNNELADYVEASADPSSENYQDISASWELGFTDFNIVVLEDDQKNIENGAFFSNAEDITKLKPLLKALGGTGKTDDGKRVYRVPSENVTPLGIGLTENPAAEVKGIAAVQEEKEKQTEAATILSNLTNVDNDKALSSLNAAKVLATVKIEENALNKNIISQSNDLNVKTERKQDMKITSIKDITDENLKEAKASAITDFIASELSTKSKEWEQEKNSLDTKLSKASEDYEKLNKDYSKIQEDLKTVLATVESLNAEKKAREEVEVFNNRMNSIAEAFEFDDEARQALVDEIKAIASDEAFAKWMKKANVLYKGFTKKKDADKKAAKETEKETKATEASASVVDEVLDKAKQEKPVIPNGSATEQPTLKDKAKLAFASAEAAFDIKY